MSRRKGSTGEREIVNIAKESGFPNSRRTAQMQAGKVMLDLPDNYPDVQVVPGCHEEVKRCQRVEIVKWCQKNEADAPEGSIPVIYWRRNGDTWRATLPAADWLALMEELHRLRATILDAQEAP